MKLLNKFIIYPLNRKLDNIHNYFNILNSWNETDFEIHLKLFIKIIKSYTLIKLFLSRFKIKR